MAKRAIEGLIVEYFTNAPASARKAMLAVVRNIDKQLTKVEAAQERAVLEFNDAAVEVEGRWQKPEGDHAAVKNL